MINYEEFMKALKELMDRAKDGAVVLVEGRRDVEALKGLGVVGKILPVSSVPRAKLVESVEGDVIILTDWDEKGEKLKREIFEMLLSNGVIADTSIRRRIFSAVNVNEVEDLVRVYIKLHTHPRSL
ncbi:toprim domain-containing protein [Archaeoglobus sp.]